MVQDADMDQLPKEAVQTGQLGEQAKEAVQTEEPGEQAKEAVQTGEPPEQAKEASQTGEPREQAKEASQTGEPREQAKEASQTGEPAGVEQATKGLERIKSESSVQLKSLDSMTTLSWGRSVSLDALLANMYTPEKAAVPIGERLLQLRSRLVQAFVDGATCAADDTKGRQVLGDLITDWVMELDQEGCESWDAFVAQARNLQDTMAISAVDCLDGWTALKALAKKEGELREQLQQKMEHADQAVAKALSNVLQHAGQANATSSSAAVTQRMAAWKKSLLDKGYIELQLVKDQVRVGTERVEAATVRLMNEAFTQYDQERPKTEDEILGALMEQVEQHMQALQLSEADPSSAGGTGGTEMVVDASVPKPTDKEGGFCCIQTATPVEFLSIYG